MMKVVGIDVGSTMLKAVVVEDTRAAPGGESSGSGTP
jgi:activator of 2-hydroxyglutaryl-CoA dehydratase